jgi:GNAT superfamily N-acetyltransferase
MSNQTEILEAALPADSAATAAWAWVAVRTLGPQHRGHMLTHLTALGDFDRSLRFGQLATDEQIRAYVERIDFERDQAFGIFDRRLQLAAMAHLAFEPVLGESEPTAEFGVSVLERWRRRGYGARLFDHAVTHARNRGVRNLLIHIARENSAMLAIVRRAGAEVQFDGAEATAQLPLPQDTLATQIEELVGHQAAELDYRFKRHVLRLDKLREVCLLSPLLRP